MADNAKTPGTGGNKPRPTGSGSSQSAKDKSRAASRPVGGKGSGGGGNKPRPGGKAGAPAGRPSGSGRGVWLAWGGVALVVIIIVVLVIVKATSGNSVNTNYIATTSAPADVVHGITTIPLSTWDKVGVTSQVQVSPPTVLKNQPPMTLDGKTPAMLYYGAEYCPFCAAERWVMATALSRFGTWSNLQITASSLSDAYAGTHTLSFHGATLDSPYITFKGVEQYTNIPIASSPGTYTTLQNPTKAEAAILTKYSSSKYLPNASSSGGISFPFVDINNSMLFSGASYDPQILAGLTWSEIAGNLSDPNNPATQAILSAGNYMSAGICQATKGQPGSVCQSSGVKAAAKALGITIG
jgi:Domain of unknown function (DUF929)